MTFFRSILIALLLTAHACAGTPYSTLFGEPPAPRSQEFPAWMDRYIAHRLRPLALGKARTTTYYVDATDGDDGNDGLTPAEAFQTLGKVHDVLDESVGNVRFRFERGETWRGYGKDYQWTAADDGHWAAVYCDLPSVTFDDYGNPNAAGPIFVVGSLDIAAATSFTQADSPNTNAWYVSTAGFGGETPHWIVDQADVFNYYTNATSVANCHATPRSFYYDSGASRLYIHDSDSNNPNDADFYVIPSNDNDCFRLEGDDNICAIKDSLFIGWGITHTTSNRHDYGISLGQSGTEECTVAYATSVYTSAHCSATWQVGGVSGGIFTIVDCHWGLNQPIAGQNGFNAYMPAGDAEYLFVRCSTDWTALDGTNVLTMDGHTTAAPAYHDLVVIYDCDGVCICGGLPPAADVSGASTDIRGFKILCQNGTTASPRAHFTPSTNMVEIGCEDWLRSVDASTAQLTATPITSLYLNGIIALDNIDRTGSGACSITSSTESANTGRFENCHFYFENTAPNTRGVGVHLQVMNNAATPGTPSNIVCKNCIWEGVSGNPSSNPLVPGVGNTSTSQVRNAYWQMLSAGVAARPQGGYSNATSPLELSQQPDVTGAAVNAQLIISEASETLYYDRNWRLRTVGDNQTTCGPFEDETIRGDVLWLPRDKILLGTP